LPIGGTASKTAPNGKNSLRRPKLLEVVAPKEEEKNIRQGKGLPLYFVLFSSVHPFV
jgi:hypothetical protein